MEAVMPLLQFAAGWVIVVAAVIVVAYAVTRKAKPPLPPIEWPKRGYYYVDPGQTSIDRWISVVNHFDEPQPKYVEHLARLLGYGPQLDYERSRPEPVTVYNPQPTEIHFLPGEPQLLGDIVGQVEAVDWIARAIRGLQPLQARLPRHLLFIGPAGLGKTGMAKVTANELRRKLEGHGDFIVTVGSEIDNAASLDAVVRRASRREGSVLFIDEFHTLMDSKFIDKWLLFLQDHRWKFLDEESPIELPDFTVIAGTTDYGKLPAAIRRRFKEFQLRPLTAEQLAGLVPLRGIPVTPDAVDLIVSRAVWDGTPAVPIALLEEALVYAQSEGRAIVEVTDVIALFEATGMDEWGLRPHDRAVVHALLRQPKTVKGKRNEADTVVYAAREDAVIAMAKVDPGAYKLDIRPRLMAREFLTTSSKGQQLTQLAVDTFARTT